MSWQELGKGQDDTERQGLRPFTQARAVPAQAHGNTGSTSGGHGEQYEWQRRNRQGNNKPFFHGQSVPLIEGWWEV